MMKKLSVPMRKSERIGGWIYYVLQLLAIPLILMLINELLGAPLGDAEINFVYFAVNFACAMFIFWRFIIANSKIALKNVGELLKGVVIGFVVYWLSSIVMGMVILYLYPDFSNVNDASIESLVNENAGLIALATVWLVPITEELFYRGLIFRGLYNHSRILAYIVSTLVFSLVHVVGYIGLYEPMLLLMCFLQYLPAGICLGLAYSLSDSIWAPVLIHIAINQIGMLAMR